jgi:hypothetical protein
MSQKTISKERLSKKKYNEIYSKVYRKKNEKKIKQKAKIYRSKNKDKAKLAKKDWYKKNKLYVKEYRKKWYLKNKLKVKKKHQTPKYRLIQKKIRIKNKEKNEIWRKDYQKRPKSILLRKKRQKLYAPILRKRVAKRKKIDVDFKLRLTLSKRVLAAVKFAKTKKAFKTEKLIGCSIKTIRTHIEKKFKKGMNWKNHGRYGWHIDHIRPLESFNLKDPKQQIIAFNYKNCQPLWAKENLEKGKKFI